MQFGSHLQNGRYEIKKNLGGGNMGTVLLAADHSLGEKLVAVKELTYGNSNPQDLQNDIGKFKETVLILAHLKHPLIPRVTDHFQEGSHYFMVMDYIEGEDLESTLSRLSQPIAEDEVLCCASQVLDILQYLAQQQPPIVHRDVNPANIIVSKKDGHAHLVDFGIARATSANLHTEAMGTPGYSPPEQYQKKADARSDLYALAATMHHALTLRDPRDHPAFEFPPVRELNASLSPEIEQILSRALEIVPEQRYQSASEMKQEIDCLLHKRDEPPSPIPLPPAPPEPWWGIKGKNLLLLITSLTLLLAIGLPPVWSLSYSASLTVRRTPTVSSLANANSTVQVTPTALSTPTPLPLPDGQLGVTKLPNGQYVGVNDGSFPRFDAKERPSSKYVAQAAQALSQKPNPDRTAALIDLEQAIAVDTNDAEAAIYRENINAINFGSYISLVVVVEFGPDYPYLSSQWLLQGAYTAQKNFNDQSGNGVKIRLLLANTSRLGGYNVPLAQQVISIVQKEHIVGVLGWRRSSSCLQVIGDLAKHSIPLLSVTAISDELTNISPYFFRVVAPNTVHTRVAAHFATAPKPHGLNAKNAVIFFDHRDSHSLNIAGHFKSDFEKNGGTILPGLNVAYFDKKPVQGVFFTSERTDRKEFSLLIEQVLTKNPAVNLIYFAGIGHQDAVEFQNALPPMEKYPDLRVVSVDTSYITEANARDRWYFTTYTYHGQWSTLTKDHNIAPSPFLGPHGNDGEYQQNFDPYLKHGATPYDYSIPDATAITSYDGLMALTLAIKDVMARKDAQNITSQDVAKALRQVAFQGVSGYISFGGDKSNGDPVNKSIVMLLAASQGIGMLCIGGGPFYPGVDQTAYNCPE